MTIPTTDQIKNASKDVAWEYAALLGAALEMGQDHAPPINHEVQEGFLVHVRNLAEFFRRGVKEFNQDPSVRVPRGDDTMYAVDFCLSVFWDEKPFSNDKKLIRAINKTLSHMTYSRDLSLGFSEIDFPFEGYLHVHGTVRLMRRTWGDFLRSVSPDYVRPLHPTDIEYWLGIHTERWGVKFRDMEDEFERRARSWSHWRLNQTPDGSV
jgi:hypothetical protein